MGRPKALLPWFGRSMIEHVVALLEGRVDERIVVTSEALPLASFALDARIVIDRDPDRGPLAALRDGLAATRADLAFVTACDAPFLTGEHVDALFACAHADSGAAAPIAEGFVQVLSAVYPARAARAAEALLSQGIASPAALLEQIGFTRFDADLRGATRAAPAPWTGFNTPGEYLALARHRDPGATASVEWGGRRCEVPIGRLAEVLERAAPTGGTSIASLRARLATGALRVALAEGEMSPDADPELPIGPGERVTIREASTTGVC
jgi:molybdopterin-guanine dinucleotide biosynthesis protein A